MASTALINIAPAFVGGKSTPPGSPSGNEDSSEASVVSTSSSRSSGSSSSNKRGWIRKLFTGEAMSRFRSNEGRSAETALNEVDFLISVQTSSEDSVALLRGMVADLLQEVEYLNDEKHQMEEKVAAIREERNQVHAEYRNEIVSLLLALKGVTGEAVMVKFQDGQILAPIEASALTIQTLTKKIEKLSMVNSELRERVQSACERMDDLQGENDAQRHKIEALELQFKSINKNRQKVVQKLVDKHSKTPDPLLRKKSVLRNHGIPLMPLEN